MSPGARSSADSPGHKVFICYRREDTAAHAGRLYDAMVARFGERNVFMDVDIEPGVDFVKRITEVVSSCQVLIVVMGRNWATVEDEEGKARIADPDDFVRLEVETALRRPEVTPIPVLVSGARMPKREDLPPDLQPLTRRNALDLSDARWRYDVGRLMSTLDELIEFTRARDTVVEQPQTSGSLDGRRILEGILVAGVAAFVGRYLAAAIPELKGIPAYEIVEVILRRTETWALTGAAFAAWLAIRTKRADVLRLGTIGLLFGAAIGAISGATWGVPVLLPDPNLDDANPGASEWIEVGSQAITGGLFGALIGALWRPARIGAGLASGAVAGFLIQLIVNAIGWDDPSDAEFALIFFIRAVAITGATLATMRALDRQQTATEPAAALAAADP